MKTKLFTALFFAFTLHQSQVNASSTAALANAGLLNNALMHASAGRFSDPTDIKVVVSQKRIWLVADEMPMKCLKAHIKNSEGKIVLEKCFSSKGAEWFLNIEALPKGDYTLHLGSNQVEKFKK